MPELPEAETVRRGLEVEITGRVLAAVEATGVRSVRRHADPSELDRRLAGSKVEAVGRVGKFLTLGVGEETALVHLGMSGQLLWAPSGAVAARPRHSHVVFVFEDGSELRFVDPRTFGQVFLSAGPAASGPVRPLELAHLGPDPLTDRFAPAPFVAGLRSRRTLLKALLMDQRFLAGLGNIYSDEILFAASLPHHLPAAAVNEEQAHRLHAETRRILRSAVRLGGSSLADMQYRDVYGRPGRYQQRHQVFAREGRPCPRCRTPIRREAWGGRSTFFCPRCQAGPSPMRARGGPLS